MEKEFIMETEMFNSPFQFLLVLDNSQSHRHRITWYNLFPVSMEGQDKTTLGQ